MKVLERILLIGLITILLSVFTSSAVPTTVHINNTGPYLLKPIEDMVLYQGQNTTDLFDLDDYFQDANGDTLIFNYSSIANITVLIDSQNKVSFIVDSGTTGIRTLQFTASDGQNSVDGNVFQITIGQDSEPPKWSDPKIDRAAVYQNYYVTFTSLWTDNVDLSYFILSINQGGGWTNISSKNFTGTVNVSKETLQISGSPGATVYWMFYAYDWNGNSNVSSMQNFTIQEFQIDQNQFDNFYNNPSSSSAGNAPTTREDGIITEKFTVNLREIRVSMRQGDTLTKVIRITNLVDSTLDFTADIRGVGSMAILSDVSFTIPPKSTYDITMDFLIPKDQMPDQYYGSVVLGSGDNVVIPVVIDVKPFDALLSLDVNISNRYKFVSAGDKVTALISLKSLLDSREGQATLYYALKDFEGNILDSSNETIPFLNSFIEERSLVIPKGTSDGEYIFYAVAFFDGHVDLDSDSFFVGLRLRLLSIIKNLLYLIILICLLLLIFYLYLSYKRSKRKKNLLELYLLLNELRELVKDGKTKSAIDVYKRIKVTYGQHVSKEYLQNEEKLREELERFAKILKETPPEKLVEELKKEAPKIEEPKKEEPKVVAKEEKKEEVLKEQKKEPSLQKPSEIKVEELKKEAPKIEEPKKEEPKKDGTEIKK